MPLSWKLRALVSPWNLSERGKRTPVAARTVVPTIAVETAAAIRMRGSFLLTDLDFFFADTPAITVATIFSVSIPRSSITVVSSIAKLSSILLNSFLSFVFIMRNLLQRALF